MTALSIVFAIFLSFVNFFAEMFSQKIEKHHTRLLSASSGILAAYIFLAFLPEALKAESMLGENVFVFMLLGFILFHVLEKFVYQHVKNKNKLMVDLSELHALGFVLDHFVVGMILFFAVNSEDILTGAIIILPLFLHVISSSIALTHIHKFFEKNLLVMLALSISPLLGTIFALFIRDTFFYNTFFAMTIGTLLYVTIRDMNPQDGGEIRYFIFGAILSAVIIAFTKTLQASGLFTLLF